MRGFLLLHRAMHYQRHLWYLAVHRQCKLCSDTRVRLLFLGNRWLWWLTRRFGSHADFCSPNFEWFLDLAILPIKFPLEFCQVRREDLLACTVMGRCSLLYLVWAELKLAPVSISPGSSSFLCRCRRSWRYATGSLRRDVAGVQMWFCQDQVLFSFSSYV